MLITKISSLTGIEHTIDINISKEDLERVNRRYENGELIQNIVSILSLSDREFLMTGIIQDEWDQVMINDYQE